MKELYSKDPAQVTGAMDEIRLEDEKYKSKLISTWKRAVDFSNNIQQLETDSNFSTQTGGQLLISKHQDTRKNMYITSEMEAVIKTLISFMTRNKPTATAFAGDQSDKAKKSARQAEQYLTAKYDLDNEYDISNAAAYWSLITGTAFRKDYWDPGLGHSVKGGGRTGDNCVTLTTGFNMTFDWSSDTFENKDLPWIMESYIIPKEWVVAAYDQKGEGYTGNIGDVKDLTEGGTLGESLRQREELKYSVEGNYGQGSQINLKGRVLVGELYVRPSEQFPEGRLVVRAGDAIVYDSKSPYFFDGFDPLWHPYTVFFYERFLGRLFGKGLAEQLIPQQMRLNEINGSILENANKMAKPDWLAAEKQLKRGIINGAGGNVYTYKPLPGVPEPRKIPGVPLPQQFFQEKQDIRNQMIRQAGTNFVMQGEAPQGVTASSAIEQLLENANTQHSDLMNRWERFHEQGYLKKLKIIQKYSRFPNPELVKKMKLLAKDSYESDFDTFTGSDIEDGITISIEAGSMIPKSEKMKKDLYKEFVEQGLFGPVTEDTPRGAKLRRQIHKEFGIKNFGTDESIDVEKAEWENEQMKKGIPSEVWEEDDDDIHISVITDEMKRPAFIERATEQIKGLFSEHLAQHKESLANKTEQAQAAAMEDAQRQMEMQAMTEIKVKSEELTLDSELTKEEEVLKSELSQEEEILKAQLNKSAQRQNKTVQ